MIVAMIPAIGVTKRDRRDGEKESKAKKGNGRLAKTLAKNGEASY
jgi:hypothetical protein